MAEGEFARLPQHLSAALDRPPALTPFGSGASDLDLYALYAEYAMRQRDPGLKAHAWQAHAAATQVDHLLYLGVAERALGVAHALAGELAEAEGYFRRALARFDALPAPWQAARTLAEWAAFELGRQNSALARRHYGDALTGFQALGARPDVERVTAALRDLA